jgi:hypothetical protein
VWGNWRTWPSRRRRRSSAILVAAVDRLADKSPKTHAGHPTKLLARILDLFLTEIPPRPERGRLPTRQHDGSRLPSLAPGKVPRPLAAVLSLRQYPKGDRLRVGQRPVFHVREKTAGRRPA